jgi:hypothetical protein
VELALAGDGEELSAARGPEQDVLSLAYVLILVYQLSRVICGSNACIVVHFPGPDRLCVP